MEDDAERAARGPAPHGVGRPRGATAREVLAVAREVFLDRGFTGTTMAAVASTAGVSKASLYRDHPSKEALFAAVVADWVDAGRDAMRPHVERLVDAPDVSAGLLQLARTLQTAVLSPSVLAMRSLVTAERARQPAVAESYVENSWNRNVRALAEVLAVLDHRGLLRVGDHPQVAADQFTWLVVGAPLNELSLRGEPGHSKDQLEQIAWEAVATFAARYLP